MPKGVIKVHGVYQRSVSTGTVSMTAIRSGLNVEYCMVCVYYLWLGRTPNWRWDRDTNKGGNVVILKGRTCFLEDATLDHYP